MKKKLLNRSLLETGEVGIIAKQTQEEVNQSEAQKPQMNVNLKF